MGSPKRIVEPIPVSEPAGKWQKGGSDWYTFVLDAQELFVS